MRKKTAEYLKCRVIDYLLQRYPDIIIGNEVIFGYKRNAADLLAIYNSQIIAIEIKSSDDNLLRLANQVEEYSKVYDKILVFCSPDKIAEAKTIIHTTPVGLYSVSDNEIKSYKRAAINTTSSKEDMLASMPALYLKKTFNLQRSMISNDVRKKLLSISKKGIHQALLNFYTEKITPSFNLYIENKGEDSVIDDIPILSKASEII